MSFFKVLQNALYFGTNFEPSNALYLGMEGVYDNMKMKVK